MDEEQFRVRERFWDKGVKGLEVRKSVVDENTAGWNNGGDSDSNIYGEIAFRSLSLICFGGGRGCWQHSVG